MEQRVDDVKDDVKVESDKYLALPILRGRQLVMQGRDTSLIDYRRNNSHVAAQSNLLKVSGSYNRGERKVKSDRLKEEKRCVEKVMLVTETVYDTVIQCHHSYHKRCHTTYITGNIL